MGVNCWSSSAMADAFGQIERAEVVAHGQALLKASWTIRWSEWL
jgi:hypothetical protein